MKFLISLLVRFRWLFFLMSVAVLVFSSFGLRYFTFDGSPRVFFADDNPSYERFEQLEETYGNDFKVFLMLSVEDGLILDPDRLSIIREVTDESWQLPYVRRVDSLSNYQYTHSVNDELYVDDIFSEAAIQDQQELKLRQRVALTDHNIVNRLVSDDGKHAAVVLSLTLTADQTQTGEGSELVSKVKHLVQNIESKYPDVTISGTGSLLSTVYSLEVAQEDMAFMIPAMFGLMFLILGLLLRSVSTVIVSFLVALISAVCAIGMASWLGITFSVLSINAVIITITVAVAHCIHIFTQLFKDLRTKSKHDALESSLQINFYAVTVTTATTVIGFLSLNTNDLPPAVDLGNAAAIGAGFAWLLSLTMLPSLVMLLPFNAHKTSEALIERLMDKLADLLIARKIGVLVFMTVLSVFMIYFSFQNELNDRLTESLHKPHVFRTDTDRIDEHFGALYINSFDLDSGEENGIYNPEYLKHLDKFATYLRAQPEVTAVQSFSDIIKQLNKTMHNDDQDYYTIPDNRELIAQYVLMYELSLPLGLDLGTQVTYDRRKTLLTATMPVLDTHTDITLDRRIWEWQQSNLPAHMQNQNIAISTIWSHLTIHSLVNSLEGASMALVLISIIMLFLLRSIRYGVISLIPNLVPATFGFGIWYFYSGNVGLGLTCVAIITIGIVVDDTVHFLVKYQKALKEYKGNAELAIRATFKQVGSALFMTTSVLAAGFAVLGTSKIIINSALGQVTTVILVAAFVLDIVLLPVVLLLIDKHRKQSFKDSSSDDINYSEIKLKHVVSKAAA